MEVKTLRLGERGWSQLRRVGSLVVNPKHHTITTKIKALQRFGAFDGRQQLTDVLKLG